MLTSWEVFLGVPVPIVLWMVYRTAALKRVAVQTVLVAAAVAAGFVAHAAAISPGSLQTAARVALWRAALSDARPEGWLGGMAGTGADRPPTALAALAGAVRGFVIPEITVPTLLVAALGIGPIAALVHRRRMPLESAIPLIGFAVPPACWYLLMPRHAGYHDYELLLAVPLVATLVGWGVVGGSTWIAARARPLRLPIAVPFAALLALAASRWPSAYADMTRSSGLDFKAFGDALAGATSASDRVVTDIPVQIIDYYANRRIYRVGCDGRSLRETVDGIRRDLGGRADVVFATWSAPSAQQCPQTVREIAERHPSRSAGPISVFDLAEPRAGGRLAPPPPGAPPPSR
jgi:hypothetical protein